MDYFAQIELGLRIKMLRTEKGLTQEKLAEALGVSLEHIGKLNVGSVHHLLIWLLPCPSSSTQAQIIFFLPIAEQRTSGNPYSLYLLLLLI